MFSPFDSAYAAGLFDGEGCVYVSTTANNERSVLLRVQVAMSDPEPLEFLQERYGGNVHRYSKRNRTRVIFSWNLTAGPQIEEFLADILPYSIAKREQIQEALKFPYMGYVFGRGKTMPSEVLTERLRIKEALADLKKERQDV